MQITEHSVHSPHARTSEEVLAALAVAPTLGLKAAEVAERRSKYGANILPAHKSTSVVGILLHQFSSSVVALLAAAALIAAAFGEWLDAAAIVVVLVLNSLIGFVTELKARRSMDALRALGTTFQLVRRDRRPQRVPAEDLVPGDVVLIEDGDVATADIRLLEAANLSVDKSLLTGESVAVAKDTAPVAPDATIGDRTCMLFRGTAVTRGCAVGVVTATGVHSELGNIALLSDEARGQVAPLEKRLAQLSAQFVRVTLLIGMTIGGAGILHGQDVFLMIEAAIALAVATIPEGLPVVATLVLARGMWRMAQRNAVIERLSAVETLGATTVIFTDKTGTLTENRMVVRRIVTGSNQVLLDADGFRTASGTVDATPPSSVVRLLTIAALCNNAHLGEGGQSDTGDPMEIALLRAARLAGVERGRLVQNFHEVARTAFDSETRMMATTHGHRGRYIIAVKGAPEAILAASTQIAGDGETAVLSAVVRKDMADHADRLGREGLRVLAVAERTVKDTGVDPYRDLTLLGLVGLLDPPRRDVARAIHACRNAGIRVVMATGDYATTALSIAREIGLAGDNPVIIEGREIASPGGRARILHADVFARVSPAHKLELIAAYQAAGEVVAMTGDGVNDAPALKKADIGIAMGQRGTEVARQAAAMVLRDDAFPTIVAAIREGRIIFGNIRRFVVYLLACNLSEVMVVGLAVLAGFPLPLQPLQILFLNLVTDIFPAFALGMGRGEQDVLARPPRDPGERELLPLLDA